MGAQKKSGREFSRPKKSGREFSRPKKSGREFLRPKDCRLPLFILLLSLFLACLSCTRQCQTSAFRVTVRTCETKAFFLPTRVARFQAFSSLNEPENRKQHFLTFSAEC